MSNDALTRVAALWASDPAAREAGISIGVVTHDAVELHFPVTARVVNGHGILHGGYLFLLADTALAYSCAAADRASVTRTADIAFLAPAELGDTVRAVSRIRIAAGRLTICDVQLTNLDGALVAEFRGHAVRVS